MRIFKTREDYLKELKEPERTQALQNLNPKFKDEGTLNMWAALSGAFDWQASPQKWEYWNEIALKIIKGEYFNKQEVRLNEVEKNSEGLDAVMYALENSKLI